MVFNEKRREDELREIADAWMVRLVWSDFDQPGQVAARIRRLLARAG